MGCRGGLTGMAMSPSRSPATPAESACLNAEETGARSAGRSARTVASNAFPSGCPPAGGGASPHASCDAASASAIAASASSTVRADARAAALSASRRAAESGGVSRRPEAASSGAAASGACEPGAAGTGGAVLSTTPGFPSARDFSNARSMFSKYGLQARPRRAVQLRMLIHITSLRTIKRRFTDSEPRMNLRRVAAGCHRRPHGRFSGNGR